MPDASTPGSPSPLRPAPPRGVDTAAWQLRVDPGRVDRGIRRWRRPPRWKPTPVVTDHPTRSRAGGALAVRRGRGRRRAGAATGTTFRVRRGLQPAGRGPRPRSDDVTVVVPVRNRPGAARATSRRTRWSVVRRRRRRVHRRRRQQGDRRTARRTLCRPEDELGSLSGTQRRAVPGRHCAGGVRGLRLRACRRVAPTAPRPFRRSYGCGGRTPGRQPSVANERAGPLRTRSAVARPGEDPSAGSTGRPGLLRPERSDRGPCRHRARAGPLRPVLARRRGRRPRVASARGGLGCPLRTRECRSPMTDRDDAALVPGAPVFLRFDGRASLAAPPRHVRPVRGLRVVAGRVGAGAGRPAHLGAHDTGGIHRGDGRPPERPGARPRGRRDPDRGAWHGPRRLPALGGLARAWSPALVLALACRRTRRHAALALVLPALNDWAADTEALDPIRSPRCARARRRRLRRGVWAGCARERALEPLLPRVVAVERMVRHHAARNPSTTARAAEKARRVTPWRNAAGRAGAPSRRPPRTGAPRRSTRRRSHASGGPRARRRASAARSSPAQACSAVALRATASR